MTSVSVKHDREQRARKTSASAGLGREEYIQEPSLATSSEVAQIFERLDIDLPNISFFETIDVLIKHQEGVEMYHITNKPLRRQFAIVDTPLFLTSSIHL